MEQLKDFREEQAYTERVQQLMLAIIEQADIISGSHSDCEYISTMLNSPSQFASR